MSRGEAGVVVFSAAPVLRRPGDFFRAMRDDLSASRHLAWQLLVRNLRTQYRRSLFGFAWAVAAPLTTALVWIFLQHAGVVDLGHTRVPYPVYVLTGALLWQTFVEALNSPPAQVIGARGLIGKVSFPREALFLAGMGEVLFNACIRLGVIVATLLVFRVPLSPALLLAPLGLLALAGLGFALGLLLTPLGMLYADVQRALAIVTTLWFFLTPVVYAARTGPGAWLLRFNPVTPLLVTTREWLTAGPVSLPTDFVLTCAAACGTVLVGWVLLRLSLPHVVARWSDR